MGRHERPVFVLAGRPDPEHIWSFVPAPLMAGLVGPGICAAWRQ